MQTEEVDWTEATVRHTTFSLYAGNETDGAAILHWPTISCFSPRAIALVTFLFSFPAGLALLAVNLWRLGWRRAAIGAVLAGSALWAGSSLWVGPAAVMPSAVVYLLANIPLAVALRTVITQIIRASDPEGATVELRPGLQSAAIALGVIVVMAAAAIALGVIVVALASA